MTIGLLLAEPWSMTMTMTQPALAATSPAAFTSTSSPIIAVASNLGASTWTSVAPIQSTLPLGPPATRYAVVDLGPLGDFNPATFPSDDPNPDAQGTMGINNLGEVVYARNVNGTVRAFVWLPHPNYGLDCADADAYGRFDLNLLADRSLGTTSIARDINDSGQIVGQFGSTRADQAATDVADAILWDLSDPISTNPLHFLSELLPSEFEITDPLDPTEFVWAGAHAINDDEDPVIVGSVGVLRPCACGGSSLPGSEIVPRTAAFKFRLGVDGTYLIELGSGSNNQAQARDVSITPINLDDPDAIGLSFCEFDTQFAESASGNGEEEAPCPVDNCGQFTRAALWPELDPLALVTRTGVSALESAAHGVNDQGQMVGFGRLNNLPSNCERRALFWDDVNVSTTAVNLGSRMPDGQVDDESRAEAINNVCRTQVVGWNIEQELGLRWTLIDLDDPDDAASWDVLDLTTALRPCDGDWIIRQAHDINDDGWIAAWGTPAEGPATQRHALVLVPIPFGPGDANGDGIVNGDDLNIVIDNWNEIEDPSSCPECPFCPGDLNGDGRIDVLDLLIVIQNWAKVYDPDEFVPDVDLDCAVLGSSCGLQELAGGSASGDLFSEVLETWGFDDWNDVAAWMNEATSEEIEAFLLELVLATQ